MERVRAVSRAGGIELARPKATDVSVVRWAALIAVVEFVAVSISAYLASFLYYRIIFERNPPGSQYVKAALLIATFYFAICMIDDQYNLLGDKWARRSISRGIGAIAVAFALFLSFSFFLKVADEYSRGTLMSQLALVLPAVITVRILFAQWLERAAKLGRFKGHAVVVISLIGDSRTDELAEKLRVGRDKIVRWHNIKIKHDGVADAALDKIASRKLISIKDECRALRADAVLIIFEAVNVSQIVDMVELLYELPARIQLLPLGMTPFMQRSRIGESGNLRVLELVSQPFSLLDRFLKRTLDLLAATLMLILLSPVLILVAVAIKLDSRGPILFRQTRHGFNNEPIRVLKFRTMSTTEDGVAFRQATKNDSRITRVGRLLRRTNLDELPQLLNVMRGNMSLVGPRPHPMALNDAYVYQVRMLGRRHNVKPGITGWAQVNGFRGETDSYEKMSKRVEFDLYYIDNWSFVLDIKILFMTLLSKKAYTNAY
jgi:Undecaprenyl-phosphate glucose phosphotransferase